MKEKEERKKNRQRITKTQGMFCDLVTPLILTPLTYRTHIKLRREATLVRLSNMALNMSP